MRHQRNDLLRAERHLSWDDKTQQMPHWNGSKKKQKPFMSLSWLGIVDFVPSPHQDVITATTDCRRQPRRIEIIGFLSDGGNWSKRLPCDVVAQQSRTDVRRIHGNEQQRNGARWVNARVARRTWAALGMDFEGINRLLCDFRLILCRVASLPPFWS